MKKVFNILYTDKTIDLFMFMRRRNGTRSPAVAEGPRDAGVPVAILSAAQMWTTSISKALKLMNDFHGPYRRNVFDGWPRFDAHC